MLTPNSMPGQPGAGGRRGDRGQARAAAAGDAIAGDPVQLDRGEFLVEFQNKPSDARVRYEEVRPRADDPYLELGFRRPGEQPLELGRCSPGRAKNSAGPPVRIVVSRASG